MTLLDSLLSGFHSYLQAGSPLAYAAAFLGGILVSFTPCVYPVLPVTVGYIGSRGAGSVARGFSLSIAYVLGMALTYAALGTAAALTGRVFGEVGASPVSYLVVGNICLILALVQFNVVRIPLPSLPASGSPRNPSGLPGAFAVGLASGLVLGPCTAPVLGALLLFVGSRQSVLFGMSLLFVFALGMGLLIMVLGAFAGAAGSLPRSGPWLDRVRKGFGVVLLLAAQYLFIQAGRLFL
jgi:cytochrome c-type biogenesis protein